MEPRKKPIILIVDDDQVTRDLLAEVFQKEGWSVARADSAEAALKMVAREAPPVILSDIRMLELDGLALLREVKKLQPRSVVILMTGFGSMDGAIEAIQKGAFDYVSKPFQMRELQAVVRRALAHWESLGSVRGADGSTGKSLAVPPQTLIGRSPKIVEVYKILARATLSSSNVLIVGEGGTGKQLVARAIHDNSPRRSQKFMEISCGATSESVLEAELFGYEKGAFPGATRSKDGILAEADQGTVFLDEVGDLCPALQIKLLRVIQEGEFKPVGASESRKVDVRIIAATHRDLEACVAEGTFREDLYYRLRVISIHLPPLRDRIGDLPELVDHFVARYSEKNARSVSHVAPEAMALLAGYPWPGNIRELQHAIERAVAMSNTFVLYPQDFPEEIRAPHSTLGTIQEGPRSAQRFPGAPLQTSTPHTPAPAVDPAQVDAQAAADTSELADPLQSLEEMERLHILSVLKQVKFNKSRASEILGIDRATLYRKAQRYGIRMEGRGGV